jgi:hypothetical protein
LEKIVNNSGEDGDEAGTDAEREAVKDLG